MWIARKVQNSPLCLLIFPWFKLGNAANSNLNTLVLPFTLWCAGKDAHKYCHKTFADSKSEQILSSNGCDENMYQSQPFLQVTDPWISTCRSILKDCYHNTHQSSNIKDTMVLKGSPGLVGRPFIPLSQRIHSLWQKSAWGSAQPIACFCTEIGYKFK